MRYNQNHSGCVPKSWWENDRRTVDEFLSRVPILLTGYNESIIVNEHYFAENGREVYKESIKAAKEMKKRLIEIRKRLIKDSNSFIETKKDGDIIYIYIEPFPKLHTEPEWAKSGIVLVRDGVAIECIAKK